MPSAKKHRSNLKKTKNTTYNPRSSLKRKPKGSNKRKKEKKNKTKREKVGMAKKPGSNRRGSGDYGFDVRRNSDATGTESTERSSDGSGGFNNFSDEFTNNTEFTRRSSGTYGWGDINSSDYGTAKQTHKNKPKKKKVSFKQPSKSNIHIYTPQQENLYSSYKYTSIDDENNNTIIIHFTSDMIENKLSRIGVNIKFNPSEKVDYIFRNIMKNIKEADKEHFRGLVEESARYYLESNIIIFDFVYLTAYFFALSYEINMYNHSKKNELNLVSFIRQIESQLKQLKQKLGKKYVGDEQYLYNTIDDTYKKLNS